MMLTVFLKNEVIARGTPEEVVPTMRELQPLERSSDLLAFDDETGRQVDLDLRPRAQPPPPRPAAGRARVGARGPARAAPTRPARARGRSQRGDPASPPLGMARRATRRRV